MEIYVLELKKLPLEQKNEPLVVKWMWFLSAERREDFEKMVEEEFVDVYYIANTFWETRLHGSISENLSLSSCLREPK